MMAEDVVDDDELDLGDWEDGPDDRERISGAEVRVSGPSVDSDVVCDTSCPRRSGSNGALAPYSDEDFSCLGSEIRGTPSKDCVVSHHDHESEPAGGRHDSKSAISEEECNVSSADIRTYGPRSVSTVSGTAGKSKLSRAKPLRVTCSKPLMESIDNEGCSQTAQFGPSIIEGGHGINLTSTTREAVERVPGDKEEHGKVSSGMSTPTDVSSVGINPETQDRTQDTLEEGDVISSIRLTLPLLSPGVESNHDSCYDSDASSNGGSRRNSSQHLDTDHSDVSRTTSDTLAAEHTEDGFQEKTDVVQDLQNVTKVQSVISCSEGREGNQTDKNRSETEVENSKPAKDTENEKEGDLMGIPDYALKVEFALKLGYSEDQVRAVLAQKGCDVNQNELLSELIKTGTTGGQESDISDDESTEFENELDAETAPNASHIPKPFLEETGPPVSQVGVATDLERCKVTSTVPKDDVSNLRPIVIDGSNVAMSHGNKELFSCKGIKIVADWFKQRGHRDIVVFVPQWRKESPRADTPIADQEILDELEREKTLVYTPARRVGGKRIVCYDDRFIIQLAAENGGIVVSNDNYRDLVTESEVYRKVVETRLLMYSIVNDRFMPPEDPLGKYGPRLDNFLQKKPTVPDPTPPVCPYGKKCTYGNKCKYYHPERGSNPHRSVTEKMAEQAKIKIKEVKQRGIYTQDGRKEPSPVRKTPLSKAKSLTPVTKAPLSRTMSLQPGMGLGAMPAYGAPRMSLPGDLVAPNKGESSHGWENRESPIKVSVTAAEDSKKYNAKLAEYVHRMEEAEKAQSRSCSPRRLGSLHPQDAHGHRGSHESLKPPTHWSLAHENLRPVNSDPNSLHYKGTLGSGHLSLAKKLSDEGPEVGMRSPHLSPAQSEIQLQMDIEQAKIHAEREKLEYRLQELETAEHNIQRESEMQLYNRPHSQLSGTQSVGLEAQNTHRKLARQLSLQGREDPRLQQTPHSSTPLPGVRFHGPPVPKVLGPPVIMPEPWGSNSSLNEVFFDGPGNIQGRTFNHHHPLVRHSTISGDMGAHKAMHNLVQRIPSAPVTQQSGGTGPPPTMTRQNSTSDPQLNLASEDYVGALQGQSQYPGGPCDSRSLWAHKFQQMHPHLMSSPQLPPSGPSVPGVKVAFGQSQPMRPMSPQFTQAQMRGFYQQHGQFSSPSLASSNPLEGQPFRASNHSLHGSNQSLHGSNPQLQNLPPNYGGHNMQQQVGQNCYSSSDPSITNAAGNQFYMSSPVTYDTIHTSIASSNLYSPQQMSPRSMSGDLHGVHQSPDRAGSLSNQNMESMPVMQMNPLMQGVQYQDSLQGGSNRSNSPINQPQQYDKQAGPLLLTDSRHQHIYAHLCALFPEADVHIVVHQFPTETDPQKLCAHIMKLISHK